MDDNTPTVKPEVVFIEDLLGELAQGILRVPRFQRPFVWKPQNMLDLFDSIYKGYPVGSLLFWESSEKLESLERIGPIDVPIPEFSPKNYILDGHQRLATLFGTLLLKQHAPDKNKDEWQWRIWFDLNKNEFIHLPKNQPEIWQFPVSALLHTVNFLEQCRNILKKYPAEASELIKKAEQLAQKIKSYKIAITRIKGGSLEQAVGIFSRINRNGVSITPDQMVSALTYDEHIDKFNLSEQIDIIQEKLSEYNFGNINRMTIFHAIISAAGIPIHRSEWENLAERVKPELTNASEKAEKFLVYAASFLNYIGIPCDMLLPYSSQILMLSEFFRIYMEKQTLSQNWDMWDSPLKKTLVRWFFCTSLSGWFALQNTTKINNGLADMRRLAGTRDDAFQFMPLTDMARPFPTRFDLRSSRVRSLILFIYSLKPLNPLTGQLVDIQKIIYGSNKHIISYVFPKRKGILTSSPANRILIEKIPEKPIKMQLASLKDENSHDRNSILKSHAISEEAFQALLQDDAKTFIELRAQLLAGLEKQFILDMGIPVSDGIGDADIDTD